MEGIGIESPTQKGLHSHLKGEAIFASDQESKIRHFHDTLNRGFESEEAPKRK